MQLCLGLDVSPLRLGWGLVDLETARPVTCGVEGLARDDMDAPSAIRFALSRTLILCPCDEIAAVYIEAPHVGINRAGAINHAMAIGSAWQAVSRRWPDAVIAFVHPSEWKSRVDVKNSHGMSKERERECAVEWGACGAPDMHIPDEWAKAIAAASKPFVYLRALELGFFPEGSQDAADGALIATAGALINQEIVSVAVGA